MTRRLLNLLTALSLAACVYTAGLWASSYGRAVQRGRWSVSHTGERWLDQSFRGVVSARGGLTVLQAHRRQSFDWYVRYRVPLPPPHEWSDQVVNPSGWAMDYARKSNPRWGFDFGHAARQAGGDFLDEWQWLRIPYWAILAPTALLPAHWLWSRLRDERRRRAQRPGHCPQCGYDLRATPGRCPECGSGREAP